MSPRSSLLTAFGLIGAMLVLPSLWGPGVAEGGQDSTEPVAAKPPAESMLSNDAGASPLQSTRDRPWSPIVGKETDTDGKEWYVHEDGTRSSTLRFDENGDPVPATGVEDPSASDPLAADADGPGGSIRK